MNFWTPDNIKAVTAGTWLARTSNPGTPALTGVAIDSRTAKPGQVFIAIKGDRFDGHDFVSAVAANGSPMIIVDRESPVNGGWSGLPVNVLKVADTRKALLRLAAAYREGLRTTKVIAVCGSNGKTTTTALINAVLSAKLRGTASAKSFNNDIGVPLTILSAKPSDQYLLCEVGSNAPGEIAVLGDVVRPDIAVITSIGREHLLGFGSLAGVAKEEGAILQHLRPGGTAIVTADTSLLADHVKTLPSVVTFGRVSSADLRLTGFEHFVASPGDGPDGLVPDSIRFNVNARWTFTAPMVGEHNALNAIAAIGVARRFGLADEDIAAGLAKARPPEMRLAQVVIGGVRIVNDAYNANPDSTVAALRTFAAIHAGADRRVVVLGDNLELGDAAEAAHREIGQTILELGCIDLLITVGPLAALAADVLEGDWPAQRLVRFPELDPVLLQNLTARLREGDAVLLKGSRRIALERILKSLTETRGALTRAKS